MLTSQQHFWVGIIFLRCKFHSVRHTFFFNFYLNKTKCKRPEVKSEPTYFLTLMNDGKAFSSLDGIQLPVPWQTKKYWISWDLKKPNFSKNNLNNTRNNIKSQIQTKENGGIGELLITLNKIIRNQGTLIYFLVIMNIRLKIISVLGAPL